MNHLFSDPVEFMYGNVCEQEDASFIKMAKNLIRSSGKTIVRAALIISVPLIMITNSLHEMPLTPIGDTQISNIEVPYSISVQELRKSLIRARNYLRLTQKSIADMSLVSLASVQKFEQGQVIPKEENLEKYLMFLGLEGIFKRAYGNKRYIVEAHLRTPQSIYGGLTPIQFAASGPDGLLELLATEKRMHG